MLTSEDAGASTKPPDEEKTEAEQLPKSPSIVQVSNNDSGKNDDNKKVVNNDDDDDGVETDPTGRFSRSNELVGKGAFKTVYRGFDNDEGIEVAWNKIPLTDKALDQEARERLFAEVEMLKGLQGCKQIITMYGSWFNREENSINFITELFTSGNLRSYRLSHRMMKKEAVLKSVRNWAWQLLKGIIFLHGHDPPIIHRDLKCDNIFINGNQGEVKIGDLGLATLMKNTQAATSVLGTPEFMAPELYDEDYTEKVDIYSFGMCILELITLKYPYSECQNAAQIYKKVTKGLMPDSLNVAQEFDPECANLIELCLQPSDSRPSARDLKRDHPFFQVKRDELNKEKERKEKEKEAAKEKEKEASKDPPSDGSAQDVERTSSHRSRDPSSASLTSYDRDDQMLQRNGSSSGELGSLEYAHEYPDDGRQRSTSQQAPGLARAPSSGRLGADDHLSRDPPSRASSASLDSVIPTSLPPMPPSQQQSAQPPQQQQQQQQQQQHPSQSVPPLPTPPPSESSTAADPSSPRSQGQHSPPGATRESAPPVAPSSPALSGRAMSREFKVKGRYHQNTLRLRLRITDSEGTTRTIEFPFDVDSDTAESVADEMVEELSLTPDDRKTIVEEIGKEVDVFLPQIRRETSPAETSATEANAEVPLPSPGGQRTTIPPIVPPAETTWPGSQNPQGSPTATAPHQNGEVLDGPSQEEREAEKALKEAEEQCKREEEAMKERHKQLLEEKKRKMKEAHEHHMRQNESANAVHEEGGHVLRSPSSNFDGWASASWPAAQVAAAAAPAVAHSNGAAPEPTPPHSNGHASESKEEKKAKAQEKMNQLMEGALGQLGSKNSSTNMLASMGTSSSKDLKSKTNTEHDSAASSDAKR